MNVSTKNNLNIVGRFPIRPEHKGSDTLYIDTNKNGSLDMDDLFTNEPLIETYAAEDLLRLARKNPTQLITAKNFPTTIETETREQECEDSDDYQYTTDGDLDSLAKELSPREARNDVAWAINPSVDGRPDELEFLIIK